MPCPFHHTAPPATPTLRAGLPPLPERMTALPLDERGYPVPYFVKWLDGKPDFRVMDNMKWTLCYRERRCWVCGQKLGRFVTFAIGPMCSINRVSSEPPSHKTCAEWSVRGCPFLSRPNMVRREDEFMESLDGNVAGVMLKHNPGVTCLWTCAATSDAPRGYNTFRDDKGQPLIQILDPSEKPSWWREGREATREEVLNALENGFPTLLKACQDGMTGNELAEALAELQASREATLTYLPT